MSIDIILPVRGSPDTLFEAIDSIVAQTYRNWQLVLIDDGMPKGFLTEVRNRYATEKRLQIVPVNGSGIVDALNTGIDVTHGEFVARMDADDVAHSDRFRRQVETMSSRPSLVLLGAAFETFGGKSGKPTVAIGDRECRVALKLFNAFCHPSVIMRRRALQQLGSVYRHEFEYAEDYDLFCRIAGLGEIDNLSEVMLMYRIHSGQVSTVKRNKSLRAAAIISLNQLSANRMTVRVAFAMASAALKLGHRHWREAFRAIRRNLRFGWS